LTKSCPTLGEKLANSRRRDGRLAPGRLQGERRTGREGGAGEGG